MNKSPKYLLIPFVILSFPLLAQLQSARTDGLAVKDYFLKKKKIMSSQYDRKGNLIFEWCNRPDLLSEQDVVPYIRFYEYDGQETKVTTYMAQLKDDNKVIFNGLSSFNILVSRMIGGEIESSYEGFLDDPEAIYLIDEVPRAKVEFRKQVYVTKFIRQANNTHGTIGKNLIRDTVDLSKVVPKLAPIGEDAKVFPKQDVPGGIYYDEKGRLKKRRRIS